MIKINSIEIDLDGSTINLTLDQAQELKRELDKLFTEPSIKYWPAPTYPYERLWYTNQILCDVTMTSATDLTETDPTAVKIKL